MLRKTCGNENYKTNQDQKRIYKKKFRKGICVLMAAALAVSPVGASLVSASDTVEVKANATENEVQGILAVDNPIILTFEDGESAFCSFTPDADGWYYFGGYGTDRIYVRMYDADWNVVAEHNNSEYTNTNYYCKEGETYYFEFWYEDGAGGSLIAEVYEQENYAWMMDADALDQLSEEGTEVSISETGYFCYTPDESGYYLVTVAGDQDGGVDMMVYNPEKNEISSTDEYYYSLERESSLSIYLESGSTYFFEFSVSYITAAFSDSYTVSISPDTTYDWMDADDLSELSLGSTALDAGTTTYYKYTAPTTGDYRFMACSDDKGKAEVYVYNSNRQNVAEENVLNSVLVVSMQQDEVYYISVKCSTNGAEQYRLTFEEHNSYGSCGATINDDVYWALDGNTLTISGTGAMANFKSVAPWSDWKSSIQYVIVGEGVTSIGKNAFKGHKKIVSAGIASSVVRIGGYAFSNCTGLTSITGIISSCTMGTCAFTGCTGLADADGFIIVNKVLYGYKGSAKKIRIPSGTKRIAVAAFEENEKITEVVIPASVRAIASYAFGCIWFLYQPAESNTKGRLKENWRWCI